MPLAIFAAESHIQRSDAQVVEERRVVRTRTQRANRKLSTRPGAGVRLGALAAPAAHHAAQLQALPDRHMLFGVVDVARHAY